MTPKIKLILIILSISIFSILLHGYSFTLSDQAFHIPFLKREINPNLFTQDYLFLSPQMDYSLFYKTLALFFRLTNFNLQITYLVFYLIIHTIIFFLFYQIAYYLFKSKKVALLAIILLSTPKFIGGSAVLTLDSTFTPRFFVLPFVLISLLAAFKNKFLVSFLVNSIILLFHPFTAFTLTLVLSPLLCQSSVSKKDRIFSLAIFVGTAIARFSHQLPQIISTAVSTPIWYDIVKKRLAYNFLSSWKVEDWGSLALYILILILIFKTTHKNYSHYKKFISILITSALVVIFHYLFTEILVIPLIVKLQLSRILLYPVYLILIYLSFTLYNIYLNSSSLFKVILILNFLAISLNINLIAFLSLIFLIVHNYKFNNNLKFIQRTFSMVSILLITWLFYRYNSLSLKPSIYPATYPQDPSQIYWKDIQLWVNQNTCLDCIILVPPESPGFRIYSERAIFGDYKDGSTSLYSEIFALEWSQRMKDIENYHNFTASDFEKLRQKYYFDYIVVKSIKKLPFDISYSNKEFIIYKF